MLQNDNRNFFQLQPAEYLAIYPVVIANAERQYHVASILAANLEYGNAISHLILGSEELLKAATVLMEGKGFNLRKSAGIRKTFYNHRARHSIFKEVFSVLLAFKTFRNKSRSTSLFAGLLQGAVSGWLNYRWWEKADILKQKGFYTDYSGELSDPGSLDKNDYEKALRHTHALRIELTESMKLLEQMNKIAIDDLKKNIEVTELLSLIDESVAGK